jgi:hypothetical protein
MGDGTDLHTRFWSKVNADGICWQWTASLNTGGYGQFRLGKSMRLAHRVAYEILVSPIPDGLDLDHLCRNRGCVNPDHLEPVTRRTNILRGISGPADQSRRAQCKYGHPFDGINSYVDRRGKRQCRACVRRKVREQRTKGVRYDRKR